MLLSFTRVLVIVYYTNAAFFLCFWTSWCSTRICS
jgi:hypothetical protein